MSIHSVVCFSSRPLPTSSHMHLSVVRVFHSSLKTLKSQLPQIKRAILFDAASQIKELRFRPHGAVLTSI